MKNVLVDTGVWYAFCDPKDHQHDRDRIEDLFENLRLLNVLAPWPVVYETIRTRLAKNKVALRRLDRLYKSLRITFVDDAIYRDDALRSVFDYGLFKSPSRPLSLVDCVLRLMLEDADLKVDRFVTFNAKDFADVCGQRRIELIE